MSTVLGSPIKTNHWTPKDISHISNLIEHALRTEQLGLKYSGDIVQLKLIWNGVWIPIAAAEVIYPPAVGPVPKDSS